MDWKPQIRLSQVLERERAETYNPTDRFAIAWTSLRVHGLFVTITITAIVTLFRHT